MKWISVKDRLPETDGWYIVWHGKDEFPHAAEHHFCVRYQCWNCFDSFDEAKANECRTHACNTMVTHWMPMPEAPKEDADD